MQKYLAEEQSLKAVKDVLGNKNDKNNTNLCGCINTFLDSLINQTIKINSPKPILIKNFRASAKEPVTITGKGKIVFFSTNSGGNTDQFMAVVASVDGITLNNKLWMDRTGRCEVEFKKSITITNVAELPYSAGSAEVVAYVY